MKSSAYTSRQPGKFPLGIGTASPVGVVATCWLGEAAVPALGAPAGAGVVERSEVVSVFVTAVGVPRLIVDGSTPAGAVELVAEVVDVAVDDLGSFPEANAPAVAAETLAGSAAERDDSERGTLTSVAVATARATRTEWDVRIRMGVPRWGSTTIQTPEANNNLTSVRGTAQTLSHAIRGMLSQITGGDCSLTTKGLVVRTPGGNLR